MAARTTSLNNNSASWGDTLDIQRSALRWDVKRAMKGLCSKLEEIGEECFVVTVNVSNGWVGHLGTIRGDEYIDEKSHILYDFLNYCAESLRDDECEDEMGTCNSDTESCSAPVIENKNSDSDEEKPIQISRPSPRRTEDNIDRAEIEEYVTVEAPVQYLSKQPNTYLQHDQFILMNPVDLASAQNVAMTTNILTACAEMGKTEISAEKDSSKDGIQKKQKSRRKTEENSVQHDVKDLKINVGNHGIQVTAEDSDSDRPENESDVSESDRVLRSNSLDGLNAGWKRLLRKSGEDDESDGVDEENVKDDDEDAEDDYDADDVNDEDWAEDMEDRDRLGRFLPTDSSSKRRKNRKKRMTDELLFSNDKTVEDTHTSYESIELTQCGSGNKLSPANKEDSFKTVADKNERDSNGSVALDNEEDEKNIKSKSRKRKGKVPSHRKRSLAKDKDLHEADTEDAGNEKTIEENSEANCPDKKSLKRPSLKRKLRSVSNEKWRFVDDSLPAKTKK